MKTTLGVEPIGMDGTDEDAAEVSESCGEAGEAGEAGAESLRAPPPLGGGCERPSLLAESAPLERAAPIARAAVLALTGDMSCEQKCREVEVG